MAKLNLGAVLSNLAQSATGMLAGQAAGEQELRRRKLEEQERVRQSHATMLNVLPLLGREGQATLLSGIMGEQENMALGRPFDYKAPAPMDLSGYQGMFGGGGREASPTVGATPAMTPAAPQTGFAQFVGGLGGAEVQNPPIPFPLRGPLRGYTPGLLPPISTPMAHEMATGQMPVPPTVPPHSERQVLPPVEQVEAEQFVSRQAAPKAPAPSKGRTIATRFGELSLRGVDPKEGQRVLDDVRRLREQVFSGSFITDPTVKANVLSVTRDIPTTPVSEWSEEDLARARAAHGRLLDTVQFYGKQNPQIQAGFDQSTVERLAKDAANWHTFRPDNLQQELIRAARVARDVASRGLAQVPSVVMAQLDDIQLMEQALAAGDKPRAGLILGLIKQELTPKPKDTDPQKAFTDLLGQMPRWAGLAPEAQEPYLRRLRQMAEEVGIDPAAIPASIDRQMSEETKKRLSVAAESARNLERHRKFMRGMAERRQRHQEREDAQKDREKTAKLTPAQQAAKERLKERRSALYQRQAEILKIAPVDLKPDSENAATKRLDEIEKQIDAVNAEIDRVVGGGSTGGAGKPSGGKAAVGSMMKELADPNRPANKGAGAGGVRASNGRTYTASQLRSMPQEQRRQILRLISPADRLKLLGN